MSTKELLERYYTGLSRKSGWEEVLSNDFRFYGVGGKSIEGQGVKGKDSYCAVIARFSKSFDAVSVKDMLVTETKAFVVATYTLNSLHGTKLQFDIAEQWTIKDHKLSSLTIYYDTVSYNGFIVNGR